MNKNTIPTQVKINYNFIYALVENFNPVINTSSSLQKFLKENNTLSINVGRGSGNTYAIKNLSVKPTDLVIIKTPHNKQDFPNNKCRDFDSTFNDCGLRGLKIDRLFVDAASFYTPQQLDRMYKYLADNYITPKIFLIG